MRASMLYKTVRGRKTPITFRNQFHCFVRRLQAFGVSPLLKHYCRRVLKTRRGWGEAPLVAVRPTERDQRFGFDPITDSPPADTKWEAPYERSSEGIFRALMAKLPPDLNDYVFADLGAGKGYALCLAAEFPFKKVVGVEYSKSLAEAAAENLETYGTQSRKCPNVTCRFGDATEFSFPPEPTVLYIYNSFQGKVMDRVLANLKRSLKDQPRDLWVLYTNPWEHRKFKRSREFEVVEVTWDYAVYRVRRDGSPKNN